jgi:hypothetical protein
MAAQTELRIDADERGGETITSPEQADTGGAHAQPLPGVMDFVGANVGGELAEERWR